MALIDFQFHFISIIADLTVLFEVILSSIPSLMVLLKFIGDFVINAVLLRVGTGENGDGERGRTAKCIVTGYFSIAVTTGLMFWHFSGCRDDRIDVLGFFQLP